MGSLGLDVGGYVLAGGKSSRMGRDKALLELAGKPLVLHAVTKLQRVCEDVHILSGNRELAEYAPLVEDLHPGCGPIGGIEAAFGHSGHEWILLMPVDMPFFSFVNFAELGCRCCLSRFFGVERHAGGAIYRIWQTAAVVLFVAPGYGPVRSCCSVPWEVQGFSCA